MTLKSFFQTKLIVQEPDHLLAAVGHWSLGSVLPYAWLVLDELLHGVDALQVIGMNIRNMIKTDTERTNEAEDGEIYDRIVNIIM